MYPKPGSTGVIDVHVGDTLNCTARGQPEPEVKWYKVSGPGQSTTINGNYLMVTSDMVGRNVFNCTAKNIFNGSEVMDHMQVTFDAGKGVNTFNIGGWSLEINGQTNKKVSLFCPQNYFSSPPL